MCQVSIIICTRDRAGSLLHTLRSIGRCEVPKGFCTEVLVVDNGSVDRTKCVVAETQLANVELRYISEPQKGKGHAYNTGMREASGEVFLFTDDDVLVPGNWIDGICSPICSGQADLVAGGVKFPDSHERLLANEPFRSRRGWFASVEDIDPRYPTRMVGANMAFARHVAEALGGFDTRLGPGALGFYDETPFSWRALDAGFRLVARLEVAVEHHFDLSRPTRRHLLGLAHRMGTSDGYVEWHWKQRERVPSLKTRRDAKLGLILRRALHPWCFFSSRASDWEVCRVQANAYYQQLLAESKHTRRYVRRSPQVAEPVIG